jgi:acetyl esterase/lipase
MNHFQCIALLFLTALCSNLCFAGTSMDIRIERDLQYVPDGDAAQTLDLYLPVKPSDKPLPVVVWVHGGGWNGGSKAGGYCLFLVGQGYAVASVEYRFSRKAIFPAQIQDCQAAIRWLRANSAKYNLDPAHIGAIGGSAGGHLVSLLGTTGGKKVFAATGGNEDQSDKVQAVVDLFGPKNFNTVMEQAAQDKANDGYNLATGGKGSPYTALIGVSQLGEDEAKEKAVSPEHYVTEDCPPFLIIHGTVDRAVPYAQSVAFYNTLRTAGIQSYLQTFPNVGHGGPVFDANPALHAQILCFFDKYLKGKDVTVEPLFNALRSNLPGRNGYKPPVCALSRKGWAAQASKGEDAANAVDTDIQTRWTTNGAAAPGDWFQVDLGKSTIVQTIFLDVTGSSGGGVPAHKVYVFDDVKTLGTPVAVGEAPEQNGHQIIQLDTPATGRFVRIECTRRAEKEYWSIHEFYLLSPAETGESNPGK